MKATLIWPAALLLAGTASTLTWAGDPTWSPALKQHLLPAPDACGPGFYWTCPYGTTYGPNYYLRPDFYPTMPMLGPLSGPGGAGNAKYPGMPPLPQAPNLARFPQLPPPSARRPTAIFPTHPFARGPRDYFMVD